MFKTLITAALLLAIPAALYADEPVIEVRTLETPVVTARMFAWGLAPNARGGWSFIGQMMNYSATMGPGKEKEMRRLPTGEEYLAYIHTDIRPESEWVIMDLETGEYQLVEWPGFHSGATCLAENGRLFFGVDYGHIYYYDPAEDSVKPMGQVWDNLRELRGFYKLELGPDGMIYGAAQATSGQTMIMRLNPDTLEYKLVREVGVPGRRGLTYGYYFAMDPPWVYVAVGQGQWELFAVNMETGEKTMLAERTVEPARIVVRQEDGYSTATLTGEPGARVLYLSDGEIVAEGDRGERIDFTPPDKTYPSIEWEETEPIDITDRPEIDVNRATEIDGEGRGMIPWRPAGADVEWDVVEYTINNAEPVQIESLIALPDGSLFGNAHQYHGFFRYDIEAGDLDYFGKFPPSQNRLAIDNGLVYINGYPNTMMLVYDPDQPWTASSATDGKAEGDNPRFLGHMGQGTTEAHHCRFLVSGGNGRIYMLGQRSRWAEGAGLGYYDIADKRFFGLRTANREIDPQGLVFLADIDRIVLSGRLNGQPNADGVAPDETKLIVYDPDLNEIERLSIREGLRSTGHLTAVGGTGRIIGVIESEDVNAIYLYDVAEKKLLIWNELDEGVMGRISHRPHDNTYWIIMGGKLGRLNPESLEFTAVGGIERGVGLTRWVGERLFAASGGELVEMILP